MGQKQKGVITVYLTLTLLLVTSLLFVAIESARTALIRFFAEDAARLSAASVLADYCTPLYEGYHVFARESKGKTLASKKTFVKQEFAKMFRKNLPEKTVGDFSPAEVSVNVTDAVAITDHEGAFFRQQAAEYMEYRGAGFAAEKLLEVFGVFADTGKTAELLDRESKVQEELADIDRTILLLMQDIDGIKVTGDGVKLGWFGGVKTVPDFVKKLYIGTPSMTGVSVNVPELYGALSGKYCDPLGITAKMLEAADECRTHQAKKDANEAEIQRLNEEADALEGQEGRGGEILKLRAGAALLVAENAVLDTKLMISKAKYGIAENELNKLITGCNKAIDSALGHIKEIRQRQDAVKPSVHGFIDALGGAAEWLDANMLEGLLENAGLFEEYIGEKPPTTDRIPDLATMEKTLKADKEVLTKAGHILDLSDALTFGQTDKQDADALFYEYSFEGLLFDYTGMKLKAGGPNPLDTISSLIKSGISGLVIPEDAEISGRSYSGEDFPSLLAGCGSDDAAFDPGGGIGAMFSSSPLNGLAEVFKNGVSELAEDALYISYLFDNFGYYGKHSGHDAVCEYELEYILSGKLCDRDNLNSVVTKIVAVRTVMCFLHIMSRSEKRAEAGAFAATVLGFTGMPVLVEILKYTLILLWSFEEALIEVSALLKGKKVPAVPDDRSFVLTFPEVFMVNRALIASKSESFEGMAGLDYRAYLILFLLLQDEGTQNRRTMDIAQENIRLTFDSFRMQTLLYGFNLEASIRYRTLFPGLAGHSGYVIRYSGGGKY